MPFFRFCACTFKYLEKITIGFCQELVRATKSRITFVGVGRSAIITQLIGEKL